MPLPKGWHYEPGRRSAIGPNGARASRQAAEKMFAKQHGFPSVRGYYRALNSSGYKGYQGSKHYNDAWKEAKAAGTSKTDFNAAVAKFKENPEASRRDTSPDGPLANYLEAIGRRPKGSDYPVGEPPTVV